MGRSILSVFGCAVFASACGTVTETGVDAGTGGSDDGGGELAIATTELPTANREAPYEAQLEATGGTPPYSWSTADLPPGLSASSAGEISGTPSAAGAYDVSLTVTDDAGTTATAVVALAVGNAPVITSDTLPTLHVFEPYGAELEVAGGTPPFSFAAARLPSGLTLDPDTGEVATDPANPAITDASGALITITVTDDQGETGTAEVSLAFIGVASTTQSCAIDEEGAAWCWGQNFYGQLGNDDLGNDSPVPVAVEGGLRFTELTTGGSHSCGLDEDRAAWCWGRNNNGQLGNDDLGNDSPVPVAVEGGHRFVAMSAGNSHVCAIDEDGAAWCWGRGSFGMLGNDDTADQPTPVPVAGGHRFSAIACGLNHTCALEEGDGDAWCWGDHRVGQLGNSDADSAQHVPLPVEGGRTYSNLALGNSHSCAIDTGGDTWCWGRNGDGQLGNDDPEGVDQPVPVPVAGNQSFVRLSAQRAHTCGIDDDAALWCWGDNTTGELGNGEESESSLVPSPVAGGHAFVSVAAANSHSCALDDSATVWCWGRNLAGELGNGGRGELSRVPVAVHPSAP
jgi:alpha-tubulin suppressor-like RCC1 family protein